MIGAKSQGGVPFDGYAIAQTRVEAVAGHLDEDALLGVLHEQQRPGRVHVGDDPLDAHGTSQRGRIAAANLGDAGRPGPGSRSGVQPARHCLG